MTEQRRTEEWFEAGARIDGEPVAIWPRCGHRHPTREEAQWCSEFHERRDEKGLKWGVLRAQKVEVVIPPGGHVALGEKTT